MRKKELEGRDMLAMKIGIGDRVLLQRVSVASEWTLPEHLEGRVVTITSVRRGDLAGELNGDTISFPLEAVAEVVGHGIGKAKI